MMHTTEAVVPTRPAFISVLACLLCLNAGTTITAIFLFGRQFQQVTLIPGSVISGTVQSQLLEAWSYADFIIAIGLLRRQSWARWGYVIAGLIGVLLIIVSDQKTQGSLTLRLLFSLLWLVPSIWLLYRKDAQLYFASAKLQRPGIPRGQRFSNYLYTAAAIFAFWCLNAIVLGITTVYPQTLHRDKLLFLALPVILLAEWLGKTPGMLTRLRVPAAAFAIYLLQIFLCKSISPYADMVGPSLEQLRNWTIGTGCAAVALFCMTSAMLRASSNRWNLK